VRRVSMVLGRRNRVHALDDVSFDVSRREFCCLIGPSGCGKSTLLSLMAGFMTPTRGQVLLDSRAASSDDLARSVVFQEYALFPWLTAVGNVEFGLASRGVREGRKDHAMTYLERVGLAKFAQAYPHELSGGMQQRVAIARALAMEPSFLLMDEPLGALDALTRDQLQVLVADLWQQFNQTVVYVTHNVSEAVFLADTVVVMTAHPGRLKDVVKIDLPRPRSLKDPRFAAYVGELTDLIVGSMSQV